MCGIVGYIGPRPAFPIILEGLKRLEYRGYDSAGVALLESGGLQVLKETGKIAQLEKAINGHHFNATLGIGHTRWATHGEPSQRNAHPHIACEGRMALIHNGIIENYKSLKHMLVEKGYGFVSETDTEVIVKLVEHNLKESGDLVQAFRISLNQIEGAYGLALVHQDFPDLLLAAREGSPLVIGIGKDEYFVASDAAAIVNHTKEVIYLDDGEMVIADRHGYRTRTIDNIDVEKMITTIDYDLEAIEKAGFDHFMLKEIFEQPGTIEDAMRGRVIPEEGIVQLGGLRDQMYNILKAKRILITACGTSWHAAPAGRISHRTPGENSS
jgi:glucosamine--fructose-6-phosphate aminotransferase (isomerizing)